MALAQSGGENDLESVRDYLQALALYQQEGAERTALQIEDPDSKAQALASLAREEARAGRLEEARRTAMQAADTYWKADALVSIAAEQAKAGRPDEARNTWEEARRM